MEEVDSIQAGSIVGARTRPALIVVDLTVQPLQLAFFIAIILSVPKVFAIFLLQPPGRCVNLAGIDQCDPFHTISMHFL